MLLPKKHIRNLQPAAHGGRHYVEMQKLGIEPASLLDFSVSTNPFGPPSGLPQALIKADLESYPDSDSNLLKKRLAEKLGLAAENLIIGNGSTELIRLCSLAYLGPGDLALILQPTYGEYELAARLMGAQIAALSLAEKDDFRLKFEDLESMVRAKAPRVIFLCNPNNPTGEYLERETVQKILGLAPDSLVVLDEAYVSFLDDPWSSADLIKHPNLLIIRSMTKDYAIAGVRLGYAFGAVGLIHTLNKIKPPWNVSSLAQAAGLFVLENQGYVEEMRADLGPAGQYLRSGLEKLGLRPLPSRCNFFMVKVGACARLRLDLLKKGILIRDCASFGLPEYARLAHRSQPDCSRLIEALSELGVNNYDG